MNVLPDKSVPAATRSVRQDVYRRAVTAERAEVLLQVTVHGFSFGFASAS
jgi:hypothetical protein